MDECYANGNLACGKVNLEKTLLNRENAYGGNDLLTITKYGVVHLSLTMGE